MKRKLIITAIVALAIGFVGLAGGFTNSVGFTTGITAVCRNADGVKVTNADDPNDWYISYKKGWWMNNSEAVLDGWCGESAQQQYGYTLNEEKWEDDCVLSSGCDEYKQKFDPRSTAMFVIGGLIIGLLPLARKGK